MACSPFLLKANSIFHEGLPKRLSSASRAIVSKYSDQRILRAAGFFAIAFPSAEALLKTRAMTAAPCLVLDIGLPGLSGFELYQRLIKTGAKLPVIFITAGSERAREVGAIAYYSSPQLEQRYAASLLEGFRFVRQLIPINQLNVPS
jgi:DNA-binding LytR/AlgR family response regulator